MRNRDLVMLLALAAAVGGCASRPAGKTDSGGIDITYSTPEAPKADGRQLHMKLDSGTYRCELGETVEVRRDPRSDRQIELGWAGSRYAMVRHASSSGLPRYEHRPSGLVWIDLPWKSMLLDSGSGRPLANECKPS